MDMRTLTPEQRLVLINRMDLRRVYVHPFKAGFQSRSMCETWLRDKGFLVGPMQMRFPRAIMEKAYTGPIPKWRNIHGDSKPLADGYMLAEDPPGGNVGGRDQPWSIWLRKSVLGGTPSIEVMPDLPRVSDVHEVVRLIAGGDPDQIINREQLTSISTAVNVLGLGAMPAAAVK